MGRPELDCNYCNNCLRNKPKHTAKEELEPYELDDLRPRNIIAFDVDTQ